MGDWNLRLVDYWDQRAGAINKGAIRLGELDGPERVSACGQIRDTVRQGCSPLSDSHLLQAAVSMVDDLYKYVNDEVLMGEALFDYLDAFGRTFTRIVSERGYVIRYVVENQFSGVDFLMLGPFNVFPRVFNAAGFVYVCPQQIGLRLMEADGLPPSEYEGAIARYITEARVVGNRLVNECHDEKLHYAFLEADYVEGSLEIALRGGGAPGVLSVLRDDAPVPGSEVSVVFPEPKLRGPADK